MVFFKYKSISYVIENGCNGLVFMCKCFCEYLVLVFVLIFLDFRKYLI